MIKFKGVCLTYEKDKDDETVLKEGIELQEDGFVSFNYKNDPENMLGRVTKMTIEDDGVHVEGELFDDIDKVKVLTSHPTILQKYVPVVEGNITQRNKENPYIIEKVKIKGITLTEFPVTNNCWMKLIDVKENEDKE